MNAKNNRLFFQILKMWSSDNSINTSKLNLHSRNCFEAVKIKGEEKKWLRRVRYRWDKFIKVYYMHIINTTLKLLYAIILC
jgi:hypothetical protein